MCHKMFNPSQDDDLLNEQGSNHDEEPLKLKERVSHSLLSCCGFVVLEVDVVVKTSDSFLRNEGWMNCALDVFSLM